MVAPRPSILAALSFLLAASPVRGSQPQQPSAAFARFAPTRPEARRITGEIRDTERLGLPGNRPPATLGQSASSFVAPDQRVERMVLSLKRSPEAQLRLDKLAEAQQDITSPVFHRWLTPSQFGEMFGPAREDVDAVVAWLGRRGFTVEEISPSLMSITFSGPVLAIQKAFGTPLGYFEVDGARRYANVADPSIPAALADVVGGVVSLHDIPHKAMNRGVKPLTAQEVARYTTQGPSPSFTSSDGSHYLAAGDFAKIYDLNPLYANGIDGTGVTIGIVGRSNIKVSDVAFFRSFMGLAANNPIVVLNGADPGTANSNEVSEALLDVEWSGAVAKNATVKFVVSKSAGTDGVDLSSKYIVDNAATLGVTVMSASFGECESALGTAENQFFNDLWQQASTEGITVFVSSGDSGAAGCDLPTAVSGTGAEVSGLASTPFNVCVGGSQFKEGSNSATYWSDINSADHSSALSYIPETTWNESGTVTGGKQLFATGGGASLVYAKPTWQVAAGVPVDAKRDCPDVSLSAAGHDAYLIVQDHTSTQSGLSAVLGTSASSPSMAGVMALVVQKAGSGQGNANPRFYELGKAQFDGSGPAVFHDVTTGNNSVPGTAGFNAGVGFDLSTGLGTVDANALVNNWSPAPVKIVAMGSETIPIGGQVAFTATSSLTPNTITWSASAGTVAPASTAGDGAVTATYTAPAAIGVLSQTATVTALGSDGTTAATAPVTIYDPSAITLAISPSTTRTVLTGHTLAFKGTTNFGSVTWSATGGAFAPATVPGDGVTAAVFTAPAATGDVTVTAHSLGAATKTVTVHVLTLDLNSDTKVDVFDLLNFSKGYGPATGPADFNGDNAIDDTDLATLLAGIQ